MIQTSLSLLLDPVKLMALGQDSFRFSDLVQGLTIIIALGKKIGTFLNTLIGVLTQQHCGLHDL